MIWNFKETMRAFKFVGHKVCCNRSFVISCSNIFMEPWFSEDHITGVDFSPIPVFLHSAAAANFQEFGNKLTTGLQQIPLSCPLLFGRTKLQKIYKILREISGRRLIKHWFSGGLVASCSKDQTVRLWQPTVMGESKVLRFGLKKNMNICIQ